jgi:hypothetical protein
MSRRVTRALHEILYAVALTSARETSSAALPGGVAVDGFYTAIDGLWSIAAVG